MTGPRYQGLTAGGDREDSSGAGHLLPGEPADSGYPDDVQHWVAVYEELTGFVLQAELDLPQRLERCRTRLEHWRRRHEELSGPPGDAAHPNGRGPR